MPTDLDSVLWGLENETAEPGVIVEPNVIVEPSVIVDPGLEAFCLTRTRIARGTSVPNQPTSERVPLDAILTYISERSDDRDEA